MPEPCDTFGNPRLPVQLLARDPLRRTCVTSSGLAVLTAIVEARSAWSDSKMSSEVIITCAVTGAGDTVARSDRVPVTPAAIAAACIEAAAAGAAIAHVHVRDPRTGQGSREVALYSEVVT